MAEGGTGSSRAEAPKYPAFLADKTREFSQSYDKVELLGQGAFAEVWLCTKRLPRSRSIRKSLHGAVNASKRMLHRRRSNAGTPRSSADTAELDQSESENDPSGSFSGGGSSKSPSIKGRGRLQRMWSWGQHSAHSSPRASSPGQAALHQQPGRTYHGNTLWNPATIEEGSPLEALPSAWNRGDGSLHGHGVRAGQKVLLKMSSEKKAAGEESPVEIDLSFLGRPASEVLSPHAPSPGQAGGGGGTLLRSSSSPGPKASPSILKKPGERARRSGEGDQGSGQGRVAFAEGPNAPHDASEGHDTKSSKSPRLSFIRSLSRQMSGLGGTPSRKGSPWGRKGSQRAAPLPEFAVKVVLKQGLDSQVKREDFRRELAIHKELSGKSKYIVELFEVLEDDVAVYLVLEFCRGGDLLALVRDHGKLPEASAKLIFYQVATAVAFCHSLNIVHRDIKLENILFDQPAASLYADTGATENLPRVTAKLADFGLSTKLPKGTTASELVGSKHFQAPEMLRGWRYGPRVDVWSLGVVLYAMLTGRLPFTGENEADEAGLKKAILAAKIQLEGDTWRGVSDEAKDLVQKLLTADPLKRLQAAAVVAHPWLADVAEKEGPGGAVGPGKSEDRKSQAQEEEKAPGFCCVS